jgi:hypothetical protein
VIRWLLRARAGQRKIVGAGGFLELNFMSLEGRRFAAEPRLHRSWGPKKLQAVLPAKDAGVVEPRDYATGVT